MQLDTSRFGTLQFEDDTIITFTQPIIGFQEFRRFVLLPGPPDSVVKWLQSTDSGDLAFLLMDPRQVVADYRVEIGAHDLTELAATGLDELEVHSLLVVPEDPAKVRTNLKAPILINLKQRLAKQVVLEKSDYPIQFFLAQARAEGQGPQEEVSNARADA